MIGFRGDDRDFDRDCSMTDSRNLVMLVRWTNRNVEIVRAFSIAMFLMISGCGGGVDTADLIESVEPAVIRLDITTRNGPAIGSGFVIKADGTVVTNFHVIDGATKAVATFANGKTAEVTSVLFADPDRDLAIIKLADSKSLPTLALAKQLPRKGEATIAFGSPNGLSFTASEGIVSAIRRPEKVGHEPKDGTWIQTSAPISPGSSGGPLLNRKGEVIGVNTLIVTSGQNLNFAVSAIEVSDAVAKIWKDPKPLPFGDTGPKFTDGEKRALIQVASLAGVRRDEIAKLKKQIETQAAKIKERMVIDDGAGERAMRTFMLTLVDDLNALLDKPLAFEPLDIQTLRAGQCGIFPTVITVVQVLSKSDGECLVESQGTMLKLRGLDLTNAVDSTRTRISSELVFEVLGTTTYKTVGGTTNTVFELACILDSKDLPRDLFRNDRIVDVAIPPLTEAENKQRLAYRAANEKHAIEYAAQNERAAELARSERAIRDEEARAKQQLAALAEGRRRQAAEDEKRLAKESAAQAEKEGKASTKLALAKKFIDRKETTSARKWLEQVVKDYPGTAAADEAKVLLSGLRN
ncbi:MAG: peptidase and chymotrypsin/Hap [Schlesneria sp.]|nr:peptidase and chymotrypsin/Hap [Schlesneria sp.]